MSTILVSNMIASAQIDSSFLDFSAYVHLDSIMITAKRQGFSVEEFIKVIQNDNSLEESFNNLRSQSYKYKNDIKYYNNKNSVIASYSSINEQHYTGECQWMEVLEEDVEGNYYKRSGEYNYYTSNFYERVFYMEKEPCSGAGPIRASSKAKRILEKRIVELKKLIYTPGTEAEIPFIGKKTAIFSEKMIENYDFSIRSMKSYSGVESYVFTATIKPSFNVNYPNGSVVKYLEIEMKKESYQVLSRKYKLQYNAGIYRFDLLMLVDLSKHNGEYVPSDISYDGYWKIAGKKKENCKFHFKIIEFL